MNGFAYSASTVFAGAVGAAGRRVRSLRAHRSLTRRHATEPPAIDPSAGSGAEPSQRARGGQGLGGGDRLLFTLRHHGEKAAVANDADHAGQRARRRVVDRGEARPVARRPHHARVEHPRKLEILDEDRIAEDLARNVESLHRAADETASIRRLGSGAAGRSTRSAVSETSSQ